MEDSSETHRVFATLRIFGKHVAPDEITHHLGISPSKSHKRGDVRGEGTWPQGYWGITSQDQLISLDLSLHITWLLNQIEPIQSQFASIISSDVQADIFCFVETSSYNEGISFKPELLLRLAVLNLELSLDLYFAF